MERLKAEITISGKVYPLKFTVGFWKQLKQLDVSQGTIEKRLQEDFGTVATEVIYQGIKYGIGQKDSDTMPVTKEEIEGQLERNVMDAIEEALINGMTKAEQEIVQLAKQEQKKKLDALTEELSGKKQLPSESISST